MATVATAPITELERRLRAEVLGLDGVKSVYLHWLDHLAVITVLTAKKDYNLERTIIEKELELMDAMAAAIDLVIVPESDYSGTPEGNLLRAS